MLEIRRKDYSDDAAMADIGAMHMELLHFGPFAGLGETFVREVCYRKEAEEGVLQLAIATIDGEVAGFTAYTSLPFEFHKSIMHKHWLLASAMAARSIAVRPKRIAALPRIFKTIGARVRESRTRDDTLGEIVCVAVRPEFLKREITDRIGARVPVELLRFAASDLYENHGVRRLRMIVDADNRHALFMYHSLGARFESIVWAGEDKTDVYFELGAEHSSLVQPAVDA